MVYKKIKVDSETLNPENGNFFTEEDLKKVLEIGLNALGNQCT